jgi:lipid-A-disaccharide synthase
MPIDMENKSVADSGSMKGANCHLYAMVACESSGDALGEGLIKAIRSLDPDAIFIGVFGPKMRQAAGNSGRQLFDMEDLAVMGIGEVIKSLPKILYIRRNLIKTLKELHPVVYVGIDAPDFNLHVELKLKNAGISTVHYVSPSIWAWRPSRIHKIKAATDMVLSILPFEKDFYAKYDAPCTYVGHRLAREIPMNVPMNAARLALNFSDEAMKSNQVVGILPGSRKAEITFLTPEFAEAAYGLQKRYPVMRFISAATTREKAELISKLWQKHAPNIPLTIWVGRSKEVMSASNALMIASGTATLEAMLLNKSMVVCYIVSNITAMIGRKMLKVDMFSLPNLLSGGKIVPELIQDDCNPTNIIREINKIFISDNRKLFMEFNRLHKLLNLDSDRLAAAAVFKVIADREKRMMNENTPDSATESHGGNMSNGEASPENAESLRKVTEQKVSTLNQDAG